MCENSEQDFELWYWFECIILKSSMLELDQHWIRFPRCVQASICVTSKPVTKALLGAHQLPCQIGWETPWFLQLSCLLAKILPTVVCCHLLGLMYCCHLVEYRYDGKGLSSSSVQWVSITLFGKDHTGQIFVLLAGDKKYQSEILQLWLIQLNKW